MNGEGLASEMASLSILDRHILVEKWRNIYGTEPPLRISQNFLTRAIAYRMQEQVFGGLKPTTRRFLDGFLKEEKLPVSAVNIKPGTRLIREWHGITYEVLVTEEGVILDGKKYRSLTEVACYITGVKWSGPRFFGLKSKVVE
jgi:hypothetical protein